MANVIQFTIKGNTSGATKAMDKMRNAMKRIAAVSAIVGTALLAAFTYSLKSVVDVGSKVENLKIRLDALLGSTQEGGKAFKQMAAFASTVPFSYDAIMESATTLAGVVTGGADEISQWMPIIADLATVSGLSIQDATGQVQRMLSAGAGAADLFRERGITAMLGFTAGVAVSAEDTKKQLIKAFEDPASKFRGASMKMATTWDGVLSMIGDKWFTFKSAIAESGIFNYIKSIALAFDQYFNKALTDGTLNAQSFSDSMIAGLKSIMVGVGFVADVFRGLQVVWKILEVAFAKFAEYTIGLLFTIVDGWRQLANLIPSINLGSLDTMGSMLSSAKSRTSELTTELKSLVEEGMPSEKIKEFGEAVDVIFTELSKKAVETKAIVDGSITALTASAQKQMEITRIAIEEKFIALSESLVTERETELLSYEERSLDLQNYYLTTNLADDDYRKLKEKLDVDHLKKMSAINLVDLKTKMNLTLNSNGIKLSVQQIHQKKVEALKEAHLKKLASSNKLALEGSYQFGKSIRDRDLAGAISHASSMASSSRASNKTAFRIQKSLALAKAVVTLPSAVIQSYENGGGYPWGLIPAGLMLVAGLSEISTIKGTSYSGAAHGGLTNVPRESTYLLQKGERVLSPNQNSDFTSAIRNGSFSGGGNGGRGGVKIENLAIHIMENATNAEAFLEMDRSMMEELVADKIIPALDSLDAQGIKTMSASRSDI